MEYAFSKSKPKYAFIINMYIYIKKICEFRVFYLMSNTNKQFSVVSKTPDPGFCLPSLKSAWNLVYPGVKIYDLMAYDRSFRTFKTEKRTGK